MRKNNQLVSHHQKMSKIVIKIRPVPIQVPTQVPTQVIVPVQVSTQTHVRTKTCNKCGLTKSATDYYKSYGKCKECVKTEQRDRNKQAKESELAIKSNPVARQEPKLCPKCHQTKTVNDFRINRGECTDCERSYGRDYNRENYEIRQKWVEENRVRMIELQANWYQTNKPHIRAKYTSRYNEDKCFRIRQLMKCHLQHRIRKISSTEDYTGTSFEQVAEWLGYNFTTEMTWENHGSMWHLDHVIPVARWDLTDLEQVDMCFNWKNISPLSGSENREKGASIDPAQIARHKAQLRQFFIENNLDDDELTTYLNKYDQQLISLGETP